MAETLVERLHPDSAAPAALEQVHELCRACHSEVNQMEPYRSLDETIGFLRHPPAAARRAYWVVRLAGQAVGFAQLSAAADSPVGDGAVMVHPEARRRGCGRALFGELAGHAAAAGCTTVAGGYATEAGGRFAGLLGAVPTRVDIRSVLMLADARLDAGPVAGYRLVSWNGPAPQRLVESYAQAREAINDAPAAAEGEWYSCDVAQVRDMEAAAARRGRQTRVTAALDRAGGVVAFTELRVDARPGAVATTEDTAVVAQHRGKGLAGWIKAESLAALRHDRPDVALVSTTNAESNMAMRAVNRRLGFRPAARLTICAVPAPGRPD
jgi:mycothiol synthase